MTKKIYVKPPPQAKTFFIAQIVILSLFLLFGASFVFIAEGEARPFVAIFSLIWLAVCISLIVNAVKTLRMIKKGKIEVAEVADSSENTESSFATKLRDLEALKKEGLISDEEYRIKREDALKEKW